MNTYFVTEDGDEYDLQAYEANTPQEAALAFVDMMGYDPYDMELVTVKVREAKVNVKLYSIDMSPRVTEVKATSKAGK